MGGMTQKSQCHARESGHPDLAARAGALDSRFRGNDTTLKDLILNDAHDQVAARPRRDLGALPRRVPVVDSDSPFVQPRRGG
jgi:hypothetical protein